MSSPTYPPSKEMADNAIITAAKYDEMYAASMSDPEAFWAEHGKRVDWIKPYTKVKNTSFAPGNIDIKWFEDGTLNVSANCIDRHLETRGNQDFELARGAWCGDYNEASTFLDLLGSGSGYNDGKFANDRVDELLTMAKTSDNTQPLYTEIEQIVSEEVPVIPVYHYTRVMMLKEYIKGWPFKNVEQNWYSKDLYRVAD